MHKMIKQDGFGKDSQIHNSHTHYIPRKNVWLRLYQENKKMIIGKKMTMEEMKGKVSKKFVL